MRRDPEMKIDVLSSGILDFGWARSLFTVGTQSFPAQRVEVIASGGTISIPLPFNIYADAPIEMTVRKSVGERVLHFGPADIYGLEFRAFSEALREDRPVPTPPEDAVNNMKVLDALFRSEISGVWESV
jgi:predicted dehydrogenase